MPEVISLEGSMGASVTCILLLYAIVYLSLLFSVSRCFECYLLFAKCFYRPGCLSRISPIPSLSQNPPA